MNAASAVAIAIASCCALLALGGLGVAEAGGYLERHAASADTLAARSAPSTGAGLGQPLWPVPQFAFTDQRGRPATEQTLLGHVWVADFIFTQCASACPLITARLVKLERELTAPELRFVSFSVDPVHDTPDALAQYAKQWAKNEQRWSLLSTDAKGLANLSRDLRVTVEASSDPANPILHSSTLFLVDAAGQVRGVYDSDDDEALGRLASDTRTLLGSAGPTPAGTPVLSGLELYASFGCAGCHDRKTVAPPLAGIAGEGVVLDDGSHVPVDAAYVRRSLVEPGAQMVAGYLKLMPSYADASPAELDGLVAYVLSLRSAPSSPAAVQAASAPPSTSGASESEAMIARAPASFAMVPGSPISNAAAAPTALVTDPVCKMQVRADTAAPHSAYRGKAYYFCSDTCKHRFDGDPSHYL
jgi:protein SCO1/2